MPSPLIETDQFGLPVQVNVSVLPKRGMSIEIVCPATNAFGMLTSSCGKGTRDVHPCVDQVKDAVPVAVCVAETVALVVTAPVLPSASPINADPAFVHDAPPLLGDITWAPAPLITRDIPLKLLDPEANVAVVPVSVTVAVLAVIVKLETVTRKAVCVVVRVIAE